MEIGTDDDLLCLVDDKCTIISRKCFHQVDECAIVSIFMSTNDGTLLLWLMLYERLNEVLDVSLTIIAMINDVMIDTGLMY
jgi:hypothetical protein